MNFQFAGEVRPLCAHYVPVVRPLILAGNLRVQAAHPLGVHKASTISQIMRPLGVHKASTISQIMRPLGVHKASTLTFFFFEL